MSNFKLARDAFAKARDSAPGQPAIRDSNFIDGMLCLANGLNEILDEIKKINQRAE